jgi:hypothetical protein
MRYLAAFAIAWIAAGSVAHAQDGGKGQRYVACSASGGFGHSFGTPLDSISGARYLTTNSRSVPAPVEPQGVRDIELVFTHRGRLLHTIHAGLTPPAGTDIAAHFSTLVAEASGMAGMKRRPAQGGAEDAIFESSDGRWTTTIARQGSELVVSCSDTELQRQTMAEFLGKVPVGARPVAPKLSVPALPALDACARADERRGLIADFERRMLESAEFADAGNRYAEALAQWKGEQLVLAGTWTKEKADRFQLELVSKPEWLGFFHKALEELDAQFKTLDVFANAQKAGNEERQCAAAADAIASIQRLTTRVLAHWDFVIRSYDEAALRSTPKAN